MILKFKKLQPEAKLLNYAHPSDAGLDLCTVEAVVIPAGGRQIIKTGIAVEIPAGLVGLVWDKSGLATKAGLTSLAGVIDAGYRGEILVCLLNTTDQDYQFAVGDKIAQLLIQPIVSVQVEEVNTLEDSSRGGDGFGSTGR